MQSIGKSVGTIGPDGCGHFRFQPTKHVNTESGRSGVPAWEYLSIPIYWTSHLRMLCRVPRIPPSPRCLHIGILIHRLKHLNTSGVIAWAPEDHPDELDDFGELAFAGLFPDRCCRSAVLHREPGGHVHVLAARCDLPTGRSLNIAPPGWISDYRPLRDMHNLEHGWADPDDPTRRRDSAAPSFELKQRKSALREGREFRSDRESITALLTEAIGDGLIADRANVAGHLSELGRITRQERDHISVRPHGAARAIRLKGAIHDAEFDAGRREAQAEIQEQILKQALERCERLALASAERSSAALSTIYKDTESTLSAAALSMEETLNRKPEALQRRIWHLWLPFILGAALVLAIQEIGDHGPALSRRFSERQAHHAESRILARMGAEVRTGEDGSRWLRFRSKPQLIEHDGGWYILIPEG